MIKKLFGFTVATLLMVQSLSAQEDFKLMFYNLLNFPLEDAIPNRLQYLEVVLDDYRPDLFMVCELNNEAGADAILTALQLINPNYQRATYLLNTSDDNIGDQNDLQQLLYYDSTKFSIENQTVVTTIFRDFNHYRLLLNTVEQNTNPVALDVIVCHLKASSGTQNQQFRLEMIEDLEAYLDNLPEDSNVVLAGDFNVYTQSEPAFQALIDDDNNIQFIDPADRIGSWHNNSNYVDVMTQSTRTQTGLGGTTGGFDDRFDFIMTSANMATNPELSYIEDSYGVFGNNANPNCYNQAILSSDCSGDTYSFTMRNALHNFSDHLPVILELQTNQSLSIEESVVNNNITIKGSSVVDNTLIISIPYNLQNQLELFIFSSLGQPIKTVDVNNSLIAIDTSQFADGIYYISNSKLQFNPLKFVVSH